MRIPFGLRTFISKTYLDLAEALPPTKKGPFAPLQQIRAEQRERARRTFEITRPPEGHRIDLASLYLFEVYSVDDIDNVCRALYRLLPSLYDPTGFKDIAQDLKRHATNVLGLAWWNIGFLVREPKSRFFGGDHAIVPTLPPEIDYVHVELGKISASLFVITLDVRLDAAASAKFQELQNGTYLPEVTFPSLMPLGDRAYAHFGSMAEASMEDAVRGWVNWLRTSVEDSLGHLLRGYLSLQSRHTRPRLPAVEVYHIKGGPESPEQIEHWLDSSRHWLMSLGVNITSTEVYSDGNLIFVPPEHPHGESSSPPRLVVLLDQLATRVNPAPYGNDHEAAIRAHVSDTLQALYPALAHLELLKLPQADIGSLRKKSFSHFGRRHSGLLSILPLFGLSDDLIRSSFLLSRTLSDFRADRSWRAQEMTELDQLLPLRGGGQQPGPGLGAALLDAIEFRGALIDRHTTFAKEWHTQYLALQNIKATFWLGVVVLLATLAGIVGFEKIGDALVSALKYLTRWFQ